jgi:lipopolysaccharide/colanic/teichoic acid biosynthesis glycosyltransferase
LGRVDVTISAGRRSEDDAVPPAPTALPLPPSAVDPSRLLQPVALPGRAPAFARRARLDALCSDVVAPLGGGLVVLAATSDSRPLADAAVAFLLLNVVARLVRLQADRARFCPALGPAYPFVHALAALAGVLGLQLATGRPSLEPVEYVVLAGVVLVLGHPAGTILRLVGVRLSPVRTAYIGPASAAGRLERAVRRAAPGRFHILGHVASPAGPQPPSTPSWLGPPERLEELITHHRVELLVLGPGAPRLQVFEELTSSCLHLPVRLAESPDFCEDAFGHVPMSEIDATWFQHLLHPRSAPSSRLAKRALDVAAGSLLALAAAPAVAVLALLVRRDGGPAFFVQQRIGQQGRPFALVKLRTMRVGASADWADDPDDPRVTPLGRVLRRTHLDELPQFLHVLRGEMSLVGPRPEQPAYVARLERTLPFYDRRHLIKPGLAGWAALRCGYGGSEAGSAWKLCHDLYYIKHRSLSLDLLILAETAAELLTGRGVSAAEARSMLEVELSPQDAPAHTPAVALAGADAAVAHVAP